MAGADGLQVLVLGPVRARVDGHEVVPGGPRERAVLAALAIAGSGGLDHDRLVDHVWGSSAPRTAHRTAQAYLSRLRSVLGQDAIRTVAGRHRLDVDSVDLWEFERLLASAREAPAAAPPALREALALWRDRTVARDSALDGVADLLQALERTRLDAQELQLGYLDDHSAVAAAEALLAEAPHRERAWAALATAHARLGRQDEALATIRAARRRLAEDLGIDLSPELEQLERDLLDQQLSPAGAPPLPSSATVLVGRDALVRDVVGALQHRRLVTLVGAGGIGKTRLALATAERLADDESVPVFFAGLAAVTSPDDARDALVEAVGAGVADLDAAFERRFGRVPGLLVVDNCEHVLGAVAELLAAQLQRSLRLRVLATSRSPLGIAGEMLVDVPPLPTPTDADDDAAAMRLFLDRAAEVVDPSSWRKREREAAAALCRTLDGIPLALELAARRLRSTDIIELTAERVDEGEPADAPRGAEARHRSLAAALGWSYRALPEAQRRAFRRLGLLHGRLPLASTAAIVGSRDLVEGLLQASLLTRTGDGVGMYEPVRQYAVSLLEPDEREVGLEHVAEEIVRFSAQAAGHLIGPDEFTWLDRVDAVHGDVRAVLEWASTHRPDLVARLAADVGYLWLLGWSPREGRRWLDAALGVARDGALGSRLLTWSSLLAVRRGDLGAARCAAEEAVQLARSLDDARLLGAALHALAMPDKYADQTGSAREHLRDAHALRLRGGDLFGAAMSLGAVADIDVNENRLDHAAEGFALGLPLMRASGSARGLVAYLHSMAELELMRGDAARAEALVQEAWGAAVRTRDSWHLGLLASVRAAAARDLGRPAPEQRARSREALRAATAQPDPQVLLEVVEHVAGWLVDRGESDAALRLLRAARRLRTVEGVPWSAPRRARRDADEERARGDSTAPDLDVPVDLGWLAAAATEALA